MEKRILEKEQEMLRYRVITRRIEENEENGKIEEIEENRAAEPSGII